MYMTAKIKVWNEYTGEEFYNYQSIHIIDEDNPYGLIHINEVNQYKQPETWDELFALISEQGGYDNPWCSYEIIEFGKED